MSQIQYVLRRSVVTVGLIFLAMTALFFFFRLMPGDFTSVVAESGADQETLDQVRANWGLDQPLYVQYYQYIGNMLTLDAGNSFQFGGSVWDVTQDRLLNSFVLVAPAITAAYLVGSVIGGVLGRYQDTMLDRWGVSSVVLIGASPAFFTGILLIIVFADFGNIFPSSGMVSTDVARALGDTNPLSIYTTTSFWHHYILPFSTIFIAYLYLPTLIMRTNVVEVSNQGFMYYHRMKGVDTIGQIRHLIKHSSLPVITLYPVSMTRAIGGMVLVEVVFNWPGIGNLLVQAVLARDLPIIQFVFFLVVVWVIIGNFVIDLLYSVIDPRVRVDE